MTSRASRILAMAIRAAVQIEPQNPQESDIDFENIEDTSVNHQTSQLKTVEQCEEPSGSGIVKGDRHFNLNSSDLPIWENSDDSTKDPDYQITSSDDESLKHWGKVLESSVENVSQDLEMINHESPGYMNTLESNITQQTQVSEAGPSNVKIKDAKKYRQIQRNKGLPYITKREKNVQARNLIPLSRCRNNCYNKISLQNHQMIFNNYWALGSYNARVLFLNSLICLKEKSTSKTKNSGIKQKNRQVTCEYYIELSGERMLVCKKCFLCCFGETNGFIRTVINKKINSPCTNFVDRRGFSRPPNALSTAKQDEIKAHINKFPAYESHYTRRDTSKKYLQPGLTISKMYSLYCLEIEDPVSLSKYSQVFHELNLKIKPPQLDTCGTCDKLHHKISASENADGKLKLTDELRNHQEKADFAYICKRNDKNLAIMKANVAAYAFDLQQCLPTPFLKTNIAFYKRQLWTYNLTVHDLATNQPFCYMWHEGVAKRGGNEMACCYPRDWQNLIASIRDKNPFKVIEMEQSSFLDFAATSKEKFTWRKVNTDGEKYSWREFRWLRYKKNEFGSLFYKNNLDENEPFKTINLKKRGVNCIKKSDIKEIQHVPPISKEKAQDLIFLLDFIDPQFHSFYRSLVVQTITNSDVHPDFYDSDEGDSDE